MKNQELLPEFNAYIQDEETKAVFQRFVGALLCSDDVNAEVAVSGQKRSVRFVSKQCTNYSYSFIIAQNWLNFYFWYPAQSLSTEAIKSLESQFDSVVFTSKGGISVRISTLTEMNAVLKFIDCV